MSSRLMNLCQRLLSSPAISPKRSSRQRRRRLNSHAAIEVLETRQLLTALDWEPVEVADQAAAFFDDSFVHEIRITFEDAGWYTTLVNSHENDASDPYFQASFVGDGIELGTIGVRFKGNSSFSGSGVKKSFKLDFNEYEQVGEDLNFLGLTKLNLNNNFNDPTMLREKLFYDYASNFVEGVSRAVHTKLYVNDVYYGLYTAVEQVDKNLVQSRFGSEEDGNLYKGAASDEAVLNDPDADFGSDLTYLGTVQAEYEDFYQLKTNETANDYSQLIELIDVLNNTATADLSAAIEPLLDVEDTLANLALNNLFVNLDSYSGSAHNYYIYDRDDTGQFTHILWDVNESFGTFTQFTERNENPLQLDPFWLPVAPGPPGQTEPELRPLAENLWAVEEYSAEYLRDLAEMLREGFDVTSATARINELAALIRADVTADPNKQYTTAQFEQNLTVDVSDGRRTIYGLTGFIAARSTYLQTVLDTYAAQSDLALNELMSVNVTTVQDQAGDFDPWVEIYNLGPGSVALAGTYLTDDAGNLTKWAIPTGNLNDGEFLTLWLDGETSEGTNHASFSVNSAGGELFLTDGSSVIDTITYGVLSNDMSLARLPDGVGDFETTNQPTFGTENLSNAIVPVEITINEIMADNDAVIEDPDEAGAFEDWVELYNSGSTSVDLTGFYLTDDSSDPTQWQFPTGSTIAAGGFLVIWADGETDQGNTHASFKLSSAGEVVELYNIDGTTLVDSVTFGAQTTNVSYGRYVDGTDSFYSMATATPGAANVIGVTSVEIYINEIMADNDATIEDPDEAGAFEDWIELYNPGSTSVDLTGFYLTDDSSDPTQWQFPTGSTIAAGGFLVIWADGETEQGNTHASFKLSSAGEVVELYNIDGVTLVDSVTFGAQTTDVSYGRYTDGTDILISMTTPTPRATNIATPQNVEITINEIMADNDSVIEDPDEAGAFDDWIELYNPGSTSIDLTGFYLTDDSTDPTQWQFPTGSTIAAGGFYVIWADNDTGQGDTHASFKLSAGGEVVELYNIDGTTLVDSITFGDQTTDVSYGRFTDGTDNIISMTTPTPGASNVSQALVVSDTHVSVTEGLTNTFTVKLALQPASNVTVNVAPTSGDSDLTVSGGATLTFTTSNWDTPQIFTLAAAEDVDLTNGSADFDITSTGLTTESVTATEVDNDAQSLVVSSTDVSINEGSTNTFTVRLAFQPAADLTVAVAQVSGDTDLTVSSRTSLTFTTSNWDTPQIVTLAAAEDEDLLNGTAVFDVTSTDLTAVSVTGTEVDNDAQSLIVSSTEVSVNEDSTNTFTVSLAFQPETDVTVAVARVSGDTDLTVNSGASLTFTSANWNSAQTVTIAAAEDEDVASSSAVFDVTSTGLTTVSVTGTEVNNDAQSLIVSSTAVPVDEGSTSTFTVSLAFQPETDVTVAVARASGDTDLTVNSGASLTFTLANWNTAQTVTVAAADDVDLVDGSAVFDVTSTGLTTVSVTGTEVDNDAQSLIVSSTEVSVDEGSTSTFTVSLAFQPEADTTVTVAQVSGDADLTVSGGASLTFTSANWNTAQTVTIAAAEDEDLINGSAVFDVTSTGLATVSVTGTEVENDAQSLFVSSTDVSINEGSTNTIMVSLAFRPEADVIVAVAQVSGDTDLTVSSGARLTFTSANWNTAQTVTIAAAEDVDLVNGSAVFDVTSTGLTTVSVTGTEIDNDTAGITVSAISGNTTEGGSTATFTVVLDAQPTADVTIALSSSDIGEGTVAAVPLTFTAASWNTAQTVTVTGVNDDLDDGDVAYTIITESAVSTDSHYSGFDAPDVSVTNTDDDPQGVLDIDLNGDSAALSDGILTLRFMAGFIDTSLITGAVDSANGVRTHADEILQYLQSLGLQLDIDGNERIEPLSDGILIVRYLAGFRDTALIAVAVDTVNGSRTTAAEIEAYLASIVPPTTGSGPVPASAIATGFVVDPETSQQDVSASGTSIAVVGEPGSRTAMITPAFTWVANQAASIALLSNDSDTEAATAQHKHPDSAPHSWDGVDNTVRSTTATASSDGRADEANSSNESILSNETGLLDHWMTNFTLLAEMLEA